MKKPGLFASPGVLFAAFLTVALAGSAAAQKTIALTGDDNYSNQSLTVGDKIVIKLRVDRSSGYSWQAAPLEAGILQQNDVKPKPPLSVQVFEFTATGPGVTNLTLNNVKKADPSKPLQTFAVMVGVSSQPGQAKPDYVVGHFKGQAPCADCPGIDQEITLYAHGPNQFVDTIYKRKVTYLGKDKTVEDSGTWVVLPGTAADPNATVYALNFETPEKTEFFWLKSEDELVPLDKEKKPISGPMDMTLNRVK
jgi:predicted secreted protein